MRTRAMLLLPNVKDEPRRELACRVPHYDLLSVASFRDTFDRTRRDRSRRWLWRLVRRFSLEAGDHGASRVSALQSRCRALRIRSISFLGSLRPSSSKLRFALFQSARNAICVRTPPALFLSGEYSPRRAYA